MEHFISNSVLNLCFVVFRYAYPEFTDLRLTISLREISENSAYVSLRLFGPEYRQAFAIVEIGFHTFTLEKKELAIEIFAEIDLRESEGLVSFKDEDAHSIIDQCIHLKPLVTEGISHFDDNFTDPGKSIRKAERKLTVRYRIYDGTYEEDEYSAFNYDEEQIAKSTLPYLESLQEIQRKFLVNHYD